MSSSAAQQSKAEEADKLMKKAKKLLAPSLLDLRLKPDWEAAAPHLDRAAILYKQSGDVDKCLDAYERAALAQERIGSPWHAAKHLEAAAEFCKLHKRWDKAVEYFKQAGEQYISAGKATTGADCMARGARAIEEHDVEAAVTLLFDAIDIYENEEREANAQDIFRQATATCVKAKRWHDAIDFLMRFASYCDRTGSATSQCRCYLGAVVTHLYAKEPKAAWRLFQDALLVDSFVASEEAFAADALFQAYRSGDEEVVTKVVQSRDVFKQLDNQVARLAMRLPQGNMDKMARRLARAMGPQEGEDDEYGQGDDEQGAGGGGGRGRRPQDEEDGDEVL